MNQNDLEEFHEVEVEESGPLIRVLLLQVSLDIPLLVMRDLFHFCHEFLWVGGSFLEFDLFQFRFKSFFVDASVGDLLVVSKVINVHPNCRPESDEVVVVVHE